MRERVKFVRLEVGSCERIDGLCRKCFLPALWRAQLHTITADGVTEAGTLTICDNCPDHMYGD